MHRRNKSGGTVTTATTTTTVSDNADIQLEQDEGGDIPSPLLGDTHRPNGHSRVAATNGFHPPPPSKSPVQQTPPRPWMAAPPMHRGHSPMSTSNSGSSSEGGKPIPRQLYTQPPPSVVRPYPDMPNTSSPFRSSFSFNAISESSSSPPPNGFSGPGGGPPRHLRHSRSQSGAVYLGAGGIMNGIDRASSPSSSSSPSSPPPPKSPRMSAPPSPLSVVDHRHRHSRIHSRNLSVFFPRPGAAPVSQMISEDDGQEIEYPPPEDTYIDGPQEGFKFGVPNPNVMPPLSPRPTGPKRRGHHHKHSVSHNFFSFMEPTSSFGSQQQQSTSTSGLQPPSSQQQQSAPGALPTPSTTHFPASSMQHKFEPGSTTISSSRREPRMTTTQATRACTFAAMQFVLGAWMWVEGQRQGSLACTGLGYWVVFDSVGVYLGWYGEKLRAEGRDTRRTFGSKRIETVALFAQAIYLIFASVYVCKEAFEHVLLSSEGGGEAAAADAHHHGAPDLLGLHYPTTLLWLCLTSLFSSGWFWSNHDRLVDATGENLPTPISVLKAMISATLSPSSSKRLTHLSSPSSPPGRLLSNPFTLLPSLFASAILCFDTFLLPSQHHAADVALACVETVTTFMVAYPAAVALGKVLLQTAPQRGLPGGHMEAFLRVMRELEHHPHILHLPAPHVWQLTPAGMKEDGDVCMVATVQLHVKKDLEDNSVLSLTSEVWERCSKALGSSAVSVSVGVVRG